MNRSGIDRIVGILEEMDRSQRPKRKITQDQYDQWRRGFVFDGLRHQRYGQSFCNHFDIQDNFLFYTIRTVSEADDYISQNYIR
jgi:hypothetical protein